LLATPEAGKRPVTDSPSEPSEKAWPNQHLGFRTVRDYSNPKYMKKAERIIQQK
jgi:hypothetical protein